MDAYDIRHTRKLVLSLEEGTVFDQHLVNDLDLHFVANITMTLLENITSEVTSTI